MHPEYPCAHCINTGAIGAVLESEFGRGVLAAFSMQSPALPGVTRRWTRISDYVAEVSNARVWGGVHYRTSVRVAEAMGRTIGECTLGKPSWWRSSLVRRRAGQRAAWASCQTWALTSWAPSTSAQRF